LRKYERIEDSMMNREEVYERLNKVFCDVFDDETISIQDSTTAKDIDGWDSLTHISLISSVEDEFDFKFGMKIIVGLRNVGELVDAILDNIR